MRMIPFHYRHIFPLVMRVPLLGIDNIPYRQGTFKTNTALPPAGAGTGAPDPVDRCE
jgi:hypothetical protein